MSIELIISLIINAVFAILLLFKSALNDILVDWWKDKKKEKNEKIERLNNLKNYLENTGTLYVSILIFFIVKQNKPEYLVKTDFERRYNENTTKLGEIINDISKSERFYPTDLRSEVKSYIETNGNFIVEAVNKNDVASIYRNINIIQSKTNELIKMIELILYS